MTLCVWFVVCLVVWLVGCFVSWLSVYLFACLFLSFFLSLTWFIVFLVVCLLFLLPGTEVPRFKKACTILNSMYNHYIACTCILFTNIYSLGTIFTNYEL